MLFYIVLLWIYILVGYIIVDQKSLSNSNKKKKRENMGVNYCVGDLEWVGKVPVFQNSFGWETKRFAHFRGQWEQ